jgi:hypothetical protein
MNKPALKTFKDLIPGQTFRKDGDRYIKVSGDLGMKLNVNGVAVPSMKRTFFPETGVSEVK